MALVNTGEPFGLPKGTVRGFIAVVCLGLIVFDFVVDQKLSTELIAFTGPYLGFYFGTRPQESAASSEDTELDPPFTGEQGGDA